MALFLRLQFLVFLLWINLPNYFAFGVDKNYCDSRHYVSEIRSSGGSVLQQVLGQLSIDFFLDELKMMGIADFRCDRMVKLFLRTMLIIAVK